VPKVLTEQQIEQYRQEGFLAPIDVMSEDQAGDYAARLQAAERDYPQELNAENRNNAHLSFGFLDELAHHPVILDAVEDLIGPDFSLWGSVLFIKEPQSSHFVSWHQDATYMGITPHDFVTPWLALTPSNLEAGCMSMILGSHRGAIRAHEDTFANDNILTRGQKIADVDEAAKVDLILRPGQMSLHHARVIHASQPNRSTRRRIGLALQAYMPSGTEQTIGENQWMPVRGNPVHPEMIVLRRPQQDMDAAATAERARVNRNYSDILYQGARERRSY
jgi:non-heme Fe2+,alpha-ketoglutarate-dependent halogenase